jgi:hypothetical protein
VHRRRERDGEEEEQEDEKTRFSRSHHRRRIVYISLSLVFKVRCFFDEIDFFSPQEREREDFKSGKRVSLEREIETVGQRERQTKERERRFASRRSDREGVLVVVEKKQRAQ